MFPGVNGFHWAFGHIVFLTVFGFALATICVTVLVALTRTSLHLNRAEKIRWHSEFDELQPHGRCCRHELTGEVESRQCPHAFDCRHCSDHPKYGPAAASTEDEVYGLSYPAKRFYHRGHTWVECESDGALTIGLDEIGRRVIGTPDAVVMPAVGTRIEANGAGWRMSKDGVEIRILAPVDGIVIATGSPEDSWFLRVQPATPVPDLRHLLRGAEIRAWVGRELERLQLLFTPEGSSAALADGGVLMHDLIDQQPHELRDSLLGEVFLEP